MTIEDIEKLIADKRIARHKGLVFFTTYDPEEATFFKSAGATVPQTTIRGVTHWEVHLHTMLDPVFSEPEGEDAEPRDLRREIVLEHFRKRDGYETVHHVPVAERVSNA